MAIKRKHKSKPHWDQTAFKEFQASLSPGRRAEDRKILRDIFKLAADSPLLAEELAWAKKHGVKFFVDRTIEGETAGYYIPGTGVLGIKASVAQNPDLAVKVIAHELRHAWQEDNGMGCNWDSDSYAGYFINIALIEADAYAFGLRARDQYRSARDVNANYLADEKTDLSNKFQEWFLQSRGQTVFYGEDFSKLYAQNMGISLADEDQSGDLSGFYTKEFKVFIPPKLSKIKITNKRDIFPLGENFTGTANYLTRLQPDFLLKTVLRPSLACTFLDAASDEQIELTAKIRKADIRQKLVQPKRRHNLP